ncbi:hypothetical protein EMCRGX_G021585, partial [Ephydatia muelleri]
RFPITDRARRLKWIKALKRQNWIPTVHSRICGDHFISGKPVNESSDVDYVPTVFSFKKTQESSETQREREVRVKSRREIIEDREREMERHRDAVEGLLLLGDSQFMCEAGTQTAALEVQCTDQRKHQRAQHLQKRRQAL